MRPAPQTDFTLIDLFAGCGGLSLGLEEAGFRPILVSEVNESALATYLTNRAHLNLTTNRDVYKLTNSLIGRHLTSWKGEGIAEVDLVSGGPPCQGYSGIGHRRTFKVVREAVPSNHLYKEMVRVVRAVKPRVFLFENVRGLLSGRWTPNGEKGEIWHDVLTTFRRIEEYAVRWDLLLAKSYGVPQNRPRVLMVGIRRDICQAAGLDPNSPNELGPNAREAGFLPRPSGDPPPHLDEVFGDLVDPKYLETGETTTYPNPPRSSFQKEMRRRRDGHPAGNNGHLTEQEYSEHSAKIREKFQYMIEHGGEIPARFRTKKFAQRVVPARWNSEGPTITATSLPDDYVHYAQPRSLTVREWARLQTFPDWYRFEGPRTTGGHRRAGNPSEGNWDREVPKYTQIGNAVPVRLASAVGLHLRRILERQGRA
jgi:DNA (cytosine-5)-methyltransferase 1